MVIFKKQARKGTLVEKMAPARTPPYQAWPASLSLPPTEPMKQKLMLLENQPIPSAPGSSLLH